MLRTIEPRSVIADYHAGYERFTVYSSTQVPSALAGAIGRYFNMSVADVTVKAIEVGGGFGCKLNVYNDEVLVAYASKALGRAVKWTETRREAANSTIQGRGWVATATITGTKDGEVLGYEESQIQHLREAGAFTKEPPKTEEYHPLRA